MASERKTTSQACQRDSGRPDAKDIEERPENPGRDEHWGFGGHLKAPMESIGLGALRGIRGISRSASDRERGERGDRGHDQPGERDTNGERHRSSSCIGRPAPRAARCAAARRRLAPERSNVRSRSTGDAKANDLAVFERRRVRRVEKGWEIVT